MDYSEYGFVQVRDLESIAPDVVTDAAAVGDVTQVGTLRAVVLHPGCII